MTTTTPTGTTTVPDPPAEPPTARGRVVFVGAVHEAVPALDALLADARVEVVAVVTGPEATGAAPSGAVDLAPQVAGTDVPLVRTTDINDPALVARLAALRPDLLVVAGWTRLLGEPLLAVPRRGCVGFHASMLPRHRGRAPVNWSILLGEAETGNTMMLLNAGVDTGAIVDQEPVPIGPDDTCGTVYERVGEAGARMLVRQLPGLLAGTAPRIPQDPDAGDLMPKRTPEMGVLDWDRSPREVHDWVRALTRPYPGAFTSVRGERVWVWRTADPRAAEVDEPPGTVLSVGPDGARVATRGGSVLVTRVSGADEEPQPAATWLRARGWGQPLRFDPVDPEVSAWVRGLGPKPGKVITTGVGRS